MRKRFYFSAYCASSIACSISASLGRWARPNVTLSLTDAAIRYGCCEAYATPLANCAAPILSTVGQLPQVRPVQSAIAGNAFHNTCFATPSGPHNPENCLENFEGDAFGCNYSGLQRISIPCSSWHLVRPYFFPSSTAVCNVCRICSYLRTISTPGSWPVDVSLFRRRQHHGRVWETCEERAGIRPSSVAGPQRQSV
jgi:hypothetical protein